MKVNNISTTSLKTVKHVVEIAYVGFAESRFVAKIDNPFSGAAYTTNPSLLNQSFFVENFLAYTASKYEISLLPFLVRNKCFNRP